MKIKLNNKKSKIMTINFTKNHQFSTRVMMNKELLEIVEETTILGLILTKDLTWRRNTENLVRKANTRMIILRNLIQFPISREDLVLIYCQYIRVILEFNSNVWFSSITDDESEDIERVQKNACRLILKGEYSDYKSALETLKLDNMKERRVYLAKRFAKKCTKLDEMKDLFKPTSNKQHEIRNIEKVEVKFAAKSRLYNSTVPTLQRMMNAEPGPQ